MIFQKFWETANSDLKPNQSEGPFAIPGTMPTSLGDLMSVSRLSQETDRAITKGCHHLRAVSHADPRAILVKGDIPHPMEFVFNRPMSPIIGKNIRIAGLVFRQARKSVSNFLSWIFSSQVGHLAFDAEHLLDIRKIKVIV